MNFFANLAKGLFSPEDWQSCSKHDIPFPKGATCPKCDAVNTTNVACNANSSREVSPYDERVAANR